MNIPAKSLAIALMLLAPLLGGCRCPSCKCVPATPVAPCSYEAAAPVPRSPEDLAALIPTSNDAVCDFPCRLPEPTECYEAIDHATCQCNAATNSVTASAVDLERHWASVLIACDQGPVEEALCLTRGLLALQSIDLRNSSAASALTTLYLLAGAEAELDYADRGIAELKATINRIDELKDGGLEAPDGLDRGALAARYAELCDNRLQLCYARLQLNGQLKRLLGCPIDTRRFFWPKIDWTPNLTEPDVEGAVIEGLAHRADLRSLHLVRCKLNRATLPVAREVLQVADGTLGTVSPAPGIVHHLRCGDCKEHEIPVRCRQLTILTADTERLAMAAIKSAAYKLITQQDRVRVAKLAVDSRRSELLKLEKRREAEEITIFEISAARGRVIEAEASLVEKVIELKIAEVGLREAQGTLAIECGYDAEICGEHCCTGCCVGGACGCDTCGCEAGCCDCVSE